MRAFFETEVTMGEFAELLREELGWLQRRVAACSRDGEMRAELLQETVRIALERAPRFLAGPSRNPRARLRCLLLASLQSACSRLLRQMRWTRPADDEISEEGHAETPESVARAREWRAGHLAAVRTLLTPNLRLAYLAVHLPHEVEPRDLEEAARFHRGGAAGLARPPEVAWKLWRHAVEAIYPRASDAEWKRKVVEILRCEGPPGEVPEEEIARGIRNLDTQLTRARARLSEAEDEEDPP